MIVTGKHLHRRTFLRAVGAAIALPMLDAMSPAFAASTEPPVRLAFTYIPNGVTMKDWKPATTGADFAFSRILKPLEAYRQDLLVLSGLDHHNAESLHELFAELARELALGLVVVTHNRSLAARAHRVLLLEDGHLGDNLGNQGPV